jgi:hypothetical protein
VQVGGHPHRGHAGIVHGGDPGAHQQTIRYNGDRRATSTPEDGEAEPGEQDGHHQ